MATLNPTDANRLNSQQFLGPATPEDTSKSPRLKTGINAQSQVISGEDPAELAALAAEYHDQFQPATALARFLVDALISADWQLRRLRRVVGSSDLHQREVWQSRRETPGSATSSTTAAVPSRAVIVHGFLL